MRLHIPLSLLAFTLPGTTSHAALSGKVTSANGTGKASITVTLVSSGISARTDSEGNWSLSSRTVGLQKTPSVAKQVGGRIQEHDGHFQIDYRGSDISGRRISVGSPMSVASGFKGSLARHSSGTPDTLIYSFNGRAFLRDTISTDSLTGIVRIFDTTWNPAIVYGYLNDTRDGQTYRTVKIGNAVWMAQNLNHVGQFTPSSLCYDDSKDSCLGYGRLYQHSVAMQACPSGWHLPDTSEWASLQDTIDRTRAKAGGMLKSKYWWNTTAAQTGTDTYGFRALPGGTKSLTGNYSNMSGYGYWWCRTPKDASNSWLIYLYRLSPIVESTTGKNTNTYSIRCVQDSL